MFIVFKHYFIMVIFLFSILFLFITDFFYQYDWMKWYVQFGPIILTFVIILIGATFEDKENNQEDDETKKPKISGRKYTALFIILLALLIISLNIFVGEPEMRIANIHNPEFWILMVVLPLLSQFNYKKRTDGT